MVNLLNRIDNLLRKIVIILFTFMVFIVIINVLSRYLLGFSITGANELGRYSLIWITFIGGSIAIKENELVGVEFIAKNMSANVRLVLLFLKKILMISFLMILVIYGSFLVGKIMGQVSPAVRLPMVVIYGIIPIGSVLMIIHIFISLFFIKNEIKDGE